MYKEKPNYGIDAPHIVRNLIIAGILLPFIYYLVLHYAYLWYPYTFVYALQLFIPLATALGYLVTAALMTWSSKIGKIKQRNKIINLIHWRGNEQVLDVGCGRGLMLIGAAKKLTTGKAIGIDIWSSYDLSGNIKGAVLANAAVEKVADRIQIETADARSMPFSDAYFDVILSNLVIHNLYQQSEREQALQEIIRVLKPGGTVIIQDIQHTQEYEEYFKRHGLVDVECSALQYLIFPPVRFVKAMKPT